MIRWTQRLLRRRAVEAEMRVEMEFHQQARAADLEAHHGLSPEAAARQAKLEFGSLEAHREEARAALGFRWIDELRGDLLYAARGLRKTPGFTFAAAGILALAIGANASFFAVYSHYALKPLPIRGADRHFDLIGRERYAARAPGWMRDEIVRMRDAARAEMEGIYSASGVLQVLVLAPVQRQSMSMAVSANYFSLLGGEPVFGRIFSEAEESEPLAVLSDAGAKRLFGAHTSAVGQPVRVRSTWFTIIGVMPPSFTGTEAAVPDLWVGSGMRAALRDDIGERQRAAGLLRAGIAPARAEAVLSAVASRFDRPATEPVTRVELRSHATYFSGDSEDTTLVAALLFAMFLLALLIACANLASLFTARMAARAHEITTRVALGASRARIVRQLLTESTVLGLTGAAAGLCLGILCLSQLHARLFSLVTSAGATVLPFSVDWRLFAYSAALGLFASVAFGLLPALRATTVMARRPLRLRGVLLSAQVAASLVLLIMAGVLVRNMYRLNSIEAGFDLDRTFDLQLEPLSGPVLARLRTHPVVAGITAVERVPLYGRVNRRPAQVGAQAFTIAYNFVDEHYFQTVGRSLISGRVFHRAESGAGARVAIVSRGAAQRLWPGSAAVGQTLTLGARPDEASADAGRYEVVGVAPDVVNGWLFEGPEPAMVYFPGAAGQTRMSSALIRLHDSTPAALTAVRRVCASVLGATGCDPRSLRDVAAMQRFPFQVAAAVAGLLGTLALLLTAIGLYSVVSYSVQQRRREIGILVAVGARAPQVMRRILGDMARYLTFGLAAGLPFCVALSAFASSSVFQIRVFDVAAWVGVPALLAGVAALACLNPVYRALRMQPIDALRQE